jgi:predicted membrane channel-forming protein YqfA (hemolysin III family)
MTYREIVLFLMATLMAVSFGFVLYHLVKASKKIEKKVRGMDYDVDDTENYY